MCPRKSGGLLLHPCEVPYCTICAKIVFTPQIFGNETPPVPLGAELVFSYHKVPHSKNTAQTLATAYFPLFQNSSSDDYAALRRPAFSTDLLPVVRDINSSDYNRSVPGTWLSPTFKLRAPDILLLSTGIWDVVHPEPVWSGYELYSHDAYMRPDFGTFFPQILQTLDETLRLNYSEPMHALFKAWQNAWRDEMFTDHGPACLCSSASRDCGCSTQGRL